MLTEELVAPHYSTGRDGGGHQVGLVAVLLRARAQPEDREGVDDGSAVAGPASSAGSSRPLRANQR